MDQVAALPLSRSASASKPNGWFAPVLLALAAELALVKEEDPFRDPRPHVSLMVGKKIQGEVEPISGNDPNTDVVVSNTGYWMGPDITIAQANKGRVRSHGRVWDFDGRSAEICQIDWHGPN